MPSPKARAPRSRCPGCRPQLEPAAKSVALPRPDLTAVQPGSSANSFLHHSTWVSRPSSSPVEGTNPSMALALPMLARVRIWSPGAQEGPSGGASCPGSPPGSRCPGASTSRSRIRWGSSILVHGAARQGADYIEGSCKVRFLVPAEADVQRIQVRARLMFQSIGFRWTHSHSPCKARETERYVACFRENAQTSVTVLAGVSD